MILQYLSNAGDEGAKRDSIYEYLKDVLPQNKTEEQKIRMLGDLLKNMSKEYLIKAEGRTWYIMSTYSGAYPFSIPGLQSATIRAEIGSF